MLNILFSLLTGFFKKKFSNNVFHFYILFYYLIAQLFLTLSLYFVDAINSQIFLRTLLRIKWDIS